MHGHRHHERPHHHLDDGVSALVWGRRVRAALEAGRKVLAIQNYPADDDYCPIGTGDDLPGYRGRDLDFFSFPHFKSVSIESLADPALLSALDNDAPGTLVAWNIDIFSSPLGWTGGRGYPRPVDDAIWLAIHERLMSSRFDSLFQLRPWGFDADEVGNSRLRETNIQSIAGTNLGRVMRTLYPELPEPYSQARCEWVVFAGGRYFTRAIDYHTFVGNGKAYPELYLPPGELHQGFLHDAEPSGAESGSRRGWRALTCLLGRA
jgi:hypothetical protein